MTIDNLNNNTNNMRKINFEKLKIAMDIEGKHVEEQNVKKDFANLIYQQGKSIEFHALALKYLIPTGNVNIAMKSAS